jgi:hypothetical protein
VLGDGAPDDRVTRWNIVRATSDAGAARIATVGAAM